ncbi:MAG: efflux RND transporter periplasmic adaptor subunit [Candidatus Electryonea clarkiae]|nr:efflux RND transporter periplasmic adaptor subunit [Candidatus Electryonea clarkiae]MDP8288899.1 efflux RND transporter periplasmic adaptor subunit [Candidatus Electryonea clarkiae]
MMKKIIGFGIIGIIIVFLVLGVMRSQKREEVQSIAKIQKQEGVPVLAVTVKPGTVSNKRSFYGTVRAANQTSVSSKLMERIDQILVKVGERVEQDQVMVQFDTTASQAAVVQQRLAMENSKKDYERMKSLFDEGAISQQMLDQVKLGFDIALENYQSSRRAVNILSPVSGIVSRIDRLEGDIAMPGDVLMTIVSSKRLEVSFDVTAQDRSLIKEGQRIKVRLDGEAGIDGKITEISLATREETRMFPITASIPATKGFYPGLLATVDVTITEHIDVLAVPADALVKKGEETFAVVIESDIAHLKAVSTGLRDNENIEIISGLNVDDVVAVYGHQTLEDGEKVKIVEE